MIEFGSDFHVIDSFNKGFPIGNYYEETVLLANGRQAIELLIYENGWSRMWLPEYFCYEVIESIRRTGVKVSFYKDFPGNNDEAIDWPNFKAGDVLLRMNYFGLRGFRDESRFSIPVIEDHSHSPFGEWAMSSNADWCVASLRKSLPIAEGGILWSPKGLKAPPVMPLAENEKLALLRWAAMDEKSRFLRGEVIDKESFRQKFIVTEEWFDQLALSQIDSRSSETLETLDIRAWFNQKKRNWQLMSSMRFSGMEILSPEKGCDSFSFVLLCDDKSSRDLLRARLIEHRVYPSILWNIPAEVSQKVKEFSERMLSIHCDARYTHDDIEQLGDIIKSALRDD